jgi:hypothetical protein
MSARWKFPMARVFTVVPMGPLGGSVVGSKDKGVVRAGMAHMKQDPVPDLTLFDGKQNPIWPVLE